MTTRIRIFAALAIIASASPAAPAAAQETDTLLALSYRSLDELVAELPGREVGLGDLLERAHEQNLDLRGSRAREASSAAGAVAARGLFDPRLSLSAGYSRRDPFAALTEGSHYGASVSQLLPTGTALGLEVTGIRSPGLAPESASRIYDSGFALTVGQPLLEGFNQADLDARLADRSWEAAAARRRRAGRELDAAIEVAYWNLAEAEAREAVLRRSLQIADALLYRNRELAERELVADVDVLTAESGVALRQAALIEGERARIDAAEALVFLAHGETAEDVLSRPGPPYKTADRPSAGVTEPDAAESVARALTQRADVQAARREAERSRIALDAARQALRPELHLDGSVGSTGRAGAHRESLDGLDEDVGWSLGLTFSQPLGDRGEEGRRDRAAWALQLDRLALAAAHNEVRRAVRVAVRAVSSNVRRLEAAERAAALASEQLRAERRRMDLGLGDSFRLLETEENAAQAELALVSARYDLARAVARYRLAVGGDPEDPE